MRVSGIKRPLRVYLRDSTKAIHDKLDAGVSASELMRPDEYARFLTCQLEAREPIEQWAADHVSAEIRPPQTSPLLREDLAELGYDAAKVGNADFSLPESADPLGMAWAIAGSQMGNKAMLNWLRKAGGETAQLPVRFLSDTRMEAFWRMILPRLKEEIGEQAAQPAITAALAVFARFEDAFGTNDTSAAA